MALVSRVYALGPRKPKKQGKKRKSKKRKKTLDVIYIGRFKS